MTIFWNCLKDCCSALVQGLKDKNNQGANLLLGLLFLSIAYIFQTEKCESGAISYLFFHGIILVALFFIRLQSSDDFMLPCLWVASVFIVLLNGVGVFVGFSTWQHTAPDESGYCPRSPYMLAFIALIWFCLEYAVIFLFVFGLLVCHLVAIIIAKLQQ